jgi:hypothetical protein
VHPVCSPCCSRCARILRAPRFAHAGTSCAPGMSLGEGVERATDDTRLHGRIGCRILTLALAREAIGCPPTLLAAASSRAVDDPKTQPSLRRPRSCDAGSSRLAFDSASYSWPTASGLAPAPMRPPAVM